MLVSERNIQDSRRQWGVGRGREGERRSGNGWNVPTSTARQLHCKWKPLLHRRFTCPSDLLSGSNWPFYLSKTPRRDITRSSTVKFRSWRISLIVGRLSKRPRYYKKPVLFRVCDWNMASVRSITNKKETWSRFSSEKLLENYVYILSYQLFLSADIFCWGRGARRWLRIADVTHTEWMERRAQPIETEAPSLCLSKNCNTTYAC